MVQNFMVQGRLFTGSQENSPEGTSYLLGGGLLIRCWHYTIHGSYGLYTFIHIHSYADFPRKILIAQTISK